MTIVEKMKRKQRDPSKQCKCWRCKKQLQEYRGYQYQVVNGKRERVKDENGNDIKLYRKICTKCKMKGIDKRYLKDHGKKYSSVLYYRIDGKFRKKYGKSKSKYEREEMVKINLPMLRFIYNGDENKPLVCLWSSDSLENIIVKNYKTGEDVHNTTMMEIHHMLVENGNSVKKSSQEPSKIISRGDLLYKKSKTIQELMSCIPVTPNSHRKIHSIDTKLDLDNYPIESRPWVLRSEENFNEFIQKYKKFKSLKYNKVLQGLYH